MSDESIVLIAVVIGLLAVAAIALVAMRARHSRQLQKHFGAEYRQAVNELGGRRRGESELEAREKRVEQLQIRPLRADRASEFDARWRSVQATFVDDPAAAIRAADHLVNEVMLSRGYPMGSFEQRAADISVDHGNVVQDYRAAHHVALENEQGRAETEDLRRAMIHYRALFQDLLETPDQLAQRGDGRRDRDEGQRRAS